ncbi:hypothetical protein RIV76_001692 [Salmonella enterica]|nr:hypothetical protein [Salmonella enterica subsp. enterica serovar 11:b:1,7]ELC1624266.1 hypothetical protein [Salmonella enterica]
MKAGKKIRSSPLLFLCFFQYAEYPIPHSFNYLINLIKFPAQFLYFVVIRKQDRKHPVRRMKVRRGWRPSIQHNAGRLCARSPGGAGGERGMTGCDGGGMVNGRQNARRESLVNVLLNK